MQAYARYAFWPVSHSKILGLFFLLLFPIFSFYVLTILCIFTISTVCSLLNAAGPAIKFTAEITIVQETLNQPEHIRTEADFKVGADSGLVIGRFNTKIYVLFKASFRLEMFYLK